MRRRRGRRAVASVVIVALGLLAACTKDESGSDTTVSIESPGVVFNDPSGPIAVAANSEFSIYLASNPSTGYEWSVAIPSGADVTMVGDGPTYEPDGSGAVGSGGTDIFRFRAGAPGATTLTFTSARPGDAQPADQRTVPVTVE